MTRLQIQNLAEKQGLNISTLMHSTGLAYSTVHRLWHNKAERFNMDTLERMARALHVRVGELFIEDAD